MDTLSFRVLDIVIGMSTDGEFTVIDKSDILKRLDNSIEVEELDSVMERLELHDMIVIKYTDDTVFGIAPRPKGKLAYEKNKFLIKKIDTSKEILSSDVSSASPFFGVFNEPTENVPVPVQTKFSYIKLAIICSISSFFGGAAATAIAYILERLF